ncbi:DUF2254 domain-containing protein [Thalassorhabdomicrobium marinisediminis]|uniref:DUF2254 domain-containing protein n=1 Tax=Thalassorhabdomicrobium marinisediminis TaxID=2170577 RepID=UPI001304AB79|nr:DUF2254 domain-containing protein [Thalassorhabdomicrobium marinisediminis]
MNFPRPDVFGWFASLRRVSRILWVRVALIIALSLIAALSAPLLDTWIPQNLKERFTEDALMPILTILASSMLTVATFSLGVMVSSHRSLADQTTPRIHRLLMEDTSTQSMLASFIGAFAFALLSIILFGAHYYSEGATVIVFAATVAIVALIIVSLIRWIRQLSRIGSVDYALERAERTARETLDGIQRRPHLGGMPMPEDGIPVSASYTIKVPQSGFLRWIDVQELSDIANKVQAEIYAVHLPGDLLLEGQPLARSTKEVDADDVAACFWIGKNRSYDQDARYAIAALRETATKALSPGINDPGTAVEVVSRLERLLWDAFKIETDDNEHRFNNVYVATTPDSVLIDTAFRDISRDGAKFVDLLLGIHRALDALRQTCNADAHDMIDQLHAAVDENAETGLVTLSEQTRYAAGRSSIGQRTR